MTINSYLVLNLGLSKWRFCKAMELYICEKPSQGKDLARILKCSSRKEGYLEGQDKTVTWCMGHLLELLEPDDYDKKYHKWNLQDLPIIPERYRYKVKKSVAKQYKVVESLVKKASQVCISTDYDREGEAIARLLLDRFYYKGPVKRLCLTALDDSSIRKALANIKQGYETEPLYKAALGRSYADWLVGMNLSRLFTLLAQKSGSKITIQIGRVITPTVALVVARDQEIANFQPQPYFELFVNADTGKGNLRAKWVVPENMQNPDGLCIIKQYAENVAQKIQGASGVITKAERKQVKETPPLPFDLTSLQQYASRKWGYTANDTLEAAQSLYEKHKATTYPRTDCQYIPDSQLQDRDNIFTALTASDPSLNQSITLACQTNHKPRCFNTSKVEAHHAIIPTSHSADISKMTVKEKNIYYAIRCFYIIQFCPDALYSKTSVEFTCQNEKFTTSGKVLLDPGYIQVLEWNGLKNRSSDKSNKKDQNQDDEEITNIPPVNQGDEAVVINTEIADKMTSPPSHFTEATLLDAMEHISRFVSDEKFKKILKETAGIGTPATRAAIIESALRYSYLERNKKWIVSTLKAQNIMPLLPNGLKSPGLTAAWEQELDKIAHKETELSLFMTNIEKWIRSIIMNYNEPEAFTLNEDYLKSNNQNQEQDFPCFKCGGPMRRIKGSRGYFWGCQNQDCKATFNDKNGQPVTRKEQEEDPSINENAPKCPKCGSPMKLRTSGKTGNKFWGCSSYPNCNGIVNFNDNSENSDNNALDTGPAPKCPQCGRTMQLKHAKSTGKSFWGCSGYPDCHYSIDLEMQQRIEAAQNDPSTPKCPKCGAIMLPRISKKTGNTFWGCSNYPRCDGILFPN